MASFKDRVIVASEKADFIANRIADGMADTEGQARELARCLRKIAVDLAQVGPKKVAGRSAKHGADPEEELIVAVSRS